jgi:hypothetical protein
VNSHRAICFTLPGQWTRVRGEKKCMMRGPKQLLENALEALIRSARLGFRGIERAAVTGQ